MEEKNIITYFTYGDYNKLIVYLENDDLNHVYFDIINGDKKITKYLPIHDAELLSDGINNAIEDLNFIHQKQLNDKLIEVRRLIRLFYELNYEDVKNTFILDTITNIGFYPKDDKYVVTIKTHRPGMIIGVHGKDINRLTEYLNKFDDIFDMSIEIKIIEDKLWNVY